MSESKSLRLSININILDEALLRQVAAERMANGGFESDPEVHLNKPLHDLAFEAMFGCNPDTMSPDQMGIEIIDWGAANR